MILGIGCDVAKTERFKKWVLSDGMIDRFYNNKEKLAKGSLKRACEYYAARFCAKEAFSKALGTGIFGFNLKEVFVIKSSDGRPSLCVEGKAKKIMNERFGTQCVLHVTLSHEKEYAIAFVVIEKV